MCLWVFASHLLIVNDLILHYGSTRSLRSLPGQSHAVLASPLLQHHTYCKIGAKQRKLRQKKKKKKPRAARFGKKPMKSWMESAPWGQGERRILMFKGVTLLMREVVLATCVITACCHVLQVCTLCVSCFIMFKIPTLRTLTEGNSLSVSAVFLRSRMCLWRVQCWS